MKRLIVFSLIATALGAGCLLKPASWSSPSQPVAPSESNGQAASSAAPTPSAAPAAAPPATQIKPPASAPKPKTTTAKPANGYVTIKDLKFGPQILAVNAGATVFWTNNDAVNHTVDSDAVRIFNSGNLAPGATFKHTFNSPGTYAYHCSAHPGMTGTIVVR